MFKAFFLSTLVSLEALAAGPVTNAYELANAVKSWPFKTCQFDLKATVTCALAYKINHVLLALQDSTGYIWAKGRHALTGRPLKAGDRVHLRGKVLKGNPEHTPDITFSHLEVLGHDPPAPPFQTSVRDISFGQLDWRYLNLRGLVRDVYPSETSATFAVLILADGTDLQRINIPLIRTTIDDLTPLVGRRISVNGFPNLNAGSSRSFAGREFHCAGIEEIMTLDDGVGDPFLVPTLESLLAKTTEQIATSGPVKSSGIVLCTWSDGNALVRTEFSDVFRIHCPDAPLPHFGDFIEASGLPLSDNFHITLTHVKWRPCAAFPINRQPVIAGPECLKSLQLRNALRARLHGCPVKIRGRILSLPDDDIFENILQVKVDTGVVPVDISSVRGCLANLIPGCEVEACGIYVMETKYDHPGTPFAKVDGFQIVLNRSNDLVVLKYPSWWTARRLVCGICTLFATIIVILIWNIALRKAAVRKGRELFKEQLGRAKADLRTEERTRLAVELHDTLAQNLTGVSMEIEAANDLRGDAPKPMLDHLGIAAKALKSCRNELRNCLWDLRSQALEEPDMAKAVLKTLQPVVNDSRLAVRFNVPRARLSDNTAHALLRVIRELVVNAIRHGEAMSVKVAGTIDGNMLLCSVTDDGQGFDPEAAPGVLQGHFGLQGIQERIDELGGTFEITSAPGNGTKAVITLTAPTEE